MLKWEKDSKLPAQCLHIRTQSLHVFTIAWEGRIPVVEIWGTHVHQCKMAPVEGHLEMSKEVEEVGNHVGSEWFLEINHYLIY